jgi:tetratricopeptide (TPR) repeat protein
MDMGDPNSAIKMYMQQIRLARSIEDPRGVATGSFNLSVALAELGQLAEAVDHAVEALRLFEKAGDIAAATVRQQLADWQTKQTPL